MGPTSSETHDRRAVRTRYAGARSLDRGHIIERCLRDAQAGAQHWMVNDAAYEARGQVLLGMGDVAAIT